MALLFLAVLLMAAQQMLPVQGGLTLKPAQALANRFNVTTLSPDSWPFEVADTPEGLAPLLRDNLAVDISILKGRTFKAKGLLEFAQRLSGDNKGYEGFNNWRGLFVVHNHNVYWSWIQPSNIPEKQGYWRLPTTAHAIKAVAAELPNTMFVINFHDHPMCKPGACPMPVFSSYKSWYPSHPNNLKMCHEDVLIPTFNHDYETLRFFPWEYKVPQAIFRGGLYCGTPQVSRISLARMTKNGVPEIDAGITSYAPGRQQFKKELGEANYVDLDAHPRYKYLLGLDGCVAGLRLTKLMLMNSVVIKEQSHWIEYWYRSYVPGKHLLEFPNRNGNVDGILPLINKLKSNDTLAQEISRSGMEFAHKYLHLRSRVPYLMRAIQEYAKLFDQQEMDSLLEALNITSDNDVKSLLLAEPVSL